jgi:hypothetical protein
MESRWRPNALLAAASGLKIFLPVVRSPAITGTICTYAAPEGFVIVR